MTSSKSEQLGNVIAAIVNLDRSMGEKYILIGGAALVCQGSLRVTMDVDILVPGESIVRVTDTLKQSADMTHHEGIIYSKGKDYEFSVDILPQIIGDKSYEDLEPYTVTILGGIRTLDLPISLGIKIRCWYMRNEEVESGLKKQHSDLSDISFLCEKMHNAQQVVDEVVARAIPVGCYNMQLVKNSLQRAGELDLFLAVRGDKFQVPWEEDSENQREYYALLMEASDETGDQIDVPE